MFRPKGLNLRPVLNLCGATLTVFERETSGIMDETEIRWFRPANYSVFFGLNLCVHPIAFWPTRKRGTAGGDHNPN